MGEMTDKEAIAILESDNPRHDSTAIRMYAAVFCIYLEAAENVRENGAVVAHPRTSEPMTNPYLAIMERQAKILSRISGERRPGLLRTERLWDCVDD